MARKKIKEFELKSIKLNQIKQFMPLDWLGTSIKEAHLVSSTKTFPSKWLSWLLYAHNLLGIQLTISTSAKRKSTSSFNIESNNDSQHYCYDSKPIDGSTWLSMELIIYVTCQIKNISVDPFSFLF